MQTALRSILVEAAPSWALAAVAALRAENARLTVLAAVVRPPALAFAGPIALPVDLHKAAEDECAARLRRAVDELPADVPVTSLLRFTPSPGALLTELRLGAYDLVAVYDRRVAKVLLRRSPVPVLILNTESE